MTQFPDCPINPRELQPPLRTEKFEALYQLVRIGTICQDLSVLLVLFVQEVDVSVLVHLAQQFDVLGCKGWLLADTEQKRRDLIQSSVALHRLAGTPKSVADGLAPLEIDDLVILENPCLLYDGGWSYTGEFNYNGKRWDNFMIEGIYDVPDSQRDLARCIVNSWQPVRSTLYEPFEVRFYDGTWSYDGNVKYDGRTDNEITNYIPYRECVTNCTLPEPPFFTIFQANFDGSDGQQSYAPEINLENVSLSFQGDTKISENFSVQGSGSVVTLNGTNGDNLRIIDGNKLIPTLLEPFTMEFWFYLDTIPQFSSHGTILSTSDRVDEQLSQFVDGFTIAIERSTLRLDVRRGNTALPEEYPSLVSLGQWYHFAFVQDIDTVTQRVYLDGIKIDENPSVDISNSIFPMFFAPAKDPGVDKYRNCYIDVVAFTNGAKYTDNFDPNTDTGLF